MLEFVLGALIILSFIVILSVANPLRTTASAAFKFIGPVRLEIVEPEKSKSPVSKLLAIPRTTPLAVPSTCKSSVAVAPFITTLLFATSIFKRGLLGLVFAKVRLFPLRNKLFCNNGPDILPTAMISPYAVVFI